MSRDYLPMADVHSSEIDKDNNSEYRQAGPMAENSEMQESVSRQHTG